MNFLQLDRVIQEISNSQPVSNDILHYMANSFSKNFKHSECYNWLLQRKSFADIEEINYFPHEFKIFSTRFKLIATDNLAYSIATKSNPTVEDLEQFSYIKPCWSLLYPIQVYLIHHPDLIKDYRGLFPFGKHLISYMRQFGDISNQPNYKDHITLRNRTLSLSKIIGLNPTIINILMFLEGESLV